MHAEGTVLESDEHGPLVIVRRRNPYLLHVGEFVSSDGGRSIWEVTKVTPGCAEIKAVVGASGSTTISASSVVDRFTREEVEKRQAQQVEARVERAANKDEHQCRNCWPGEPKEVEGVSRGRDPRCPDHLVDAEKALLPFHKPAKEIDPADVEKVLALHAEGVGFREIARRMSWPFQRGYKIIKEHEKASA